MSESSPRHPPKRLSRAKARNAVIANQLATPGMGSLMAGHWVAGLGQLVLAIVGFAMLIGWFVTHIVHQYRLLVEDVGPTLNVYGWLGKAGGLVFAAAWLWSLLTSWQILRSATTTDSGEVPPRLE
jgi:hypothetical protein